MSAIKNPAEGTPTIRVEIYNQTYNIRSDGDSEYVIGLAEFVDRRMREISSGTLTVDSLKVAILAALLMGPDGGFITGSDFLIDGGVTASYYYGPLAPQ